MAALVFAIGWQPSLGAALCCQRPLHDCEGCGLLVPVRPSRFDGWDGDPDEVYFPTCPLCESRTGQYLYFTKRHEDEKINPLRRRPR
jgi:hypothetical protein